MKNKLLSIVNLGKVYHSRKDEIEAIENVSFDVYESEFVSIVGPSGCGKSTILSILAGLEKKSQGEIVFHKYLSIGYILQDDSLFFWRSILDNFLICLEVSGQLT